MILQNLHTHSVYCDGRDTISAMVDEAIKRGFSSIGFSSHSYMSFDPGLGLNPDEEINYIREIREQSARHKGVIDVYAGLEFELYSDCSKYSSLSLDDYDYVIGSCHYFDIDGELIIFDRGIGEFKRIINTYFGGDGMEFAKFYYRNTITRLMDVYDFDIIGHYDIITKHNETELLFDTGSKKYRDYALEALHALSSRFSNFEVNTGAIARSSRTSPYPEKFILKEMKNLGLGVVISSDCHKKEYLDVNFREAAELIKECGFKEIMIFDGKEFVPSPI